MRNTWVPHGQEENCSGNGNCSNALEEMLQSHLARDMDSGRRGM